MPGAGSHALSFRDRVTLIHADSGVVSAEAYAASIDHEQCMFVWPGGSKDEVMGTCVYMDKDFLVSGENGQTEVSYRNSTGGIIPFRREGSLSDYRSNGTFSPGDIEVLVDVEKRQFAQYSAIINGGACE